MSASAYYQRATGERSARQVEDERLIGRIREVHEQNFECYGYPRVWHELLRQGEQVGRDHVARSDAPGGHPGREAAREAVAHHDRRSRSAQAPGPRQPRLHRRSRPTACGSAI